MRIGEKELGAGICLNICLKKREDQGNLSRGRGGPQGCQTSRLPHSLDNRLTGGGEVMSLTRRPPFAPQEDMWYSFLLEAESTARP
jgi:hypothetical protein